MFGAVACMAGDADTLPEKKHPFFDLHDSFYHERIYLYWGYNRESFSHSDIHIHGKGFDFNIYDVSAHDKPSPFTFNTYFGASSLTVPQYNFRLGVFIKHNLHLSVGIDHMKYVMTQNQTVKMVGYVDSLASTIFGGRYNGPTVMNPDFFTLQHTNGLNAVSLDLGWLLPIFHTRKDILHIGWNVGIGGVFMVTRTQVHWMGVWYPNNFHLSGVTGALNTGPRIELWKCFFVSAELKGGYVYLPWAPFIGNDQSGVEHHFTYLEYYIVAGLSFPLEKIKYPLIKRKKKNALPVTAG